MMRFKALLVLIFLAAQSTAVYATSYTIDANHSTINFKIRHLVSNVRGSFDQFEGSFDYEPGNPAAWKAQATIQAASIDTNVDKRDTHLRSKDFFDVDQFPTITFKSTEVTDVVEGKSAKLHGTLTIHGVEKPVVLDLEIHGEGVDPWGNHRAGFTATVEIDRKDFGLNWNEALETGGFLVGDEVQITIEVEGIAG